MTTGVTSDEICPEICPEKTMEETPPRLHASVLVLITTRRRRRTKTGTAPGTRATRTARREAPC